MNTKPLIASKSFWGALIALLPAASDTIEQLLGSGFLPPQVTPWLAGAGALLALLGRVTATSQIRGVVSSK
jgi:hypothetical protein